MTFPRIRLSLVGVLASLLAAAAIVTSAQAPAAGRETSAASVAAYQLSQQMPVDPEALPGQFYVLLRLGGHLLVGHELEEGHGDALGGHSSARPASAAW